MTSATSARDCGCADSDPLAPPPALANAAVPCCPPLETDRSCDALDFHYRLIHTATVNLDNQPRRVPVEVILHARLERCSGPLALGDLVYSTTLLPGEKVRLFTTDRRTRFALDSATSVSYRREQTSEERYFMSSMSDFMSDLTVRDEARSANQQRGSFETHGETNGAIQAFFAGPSIDVAGSYNAESTSDFIRELNQHARASSERAVEATRAASSVSVGEVQSRSHAEGESVDRRLESRRARQPNQLSSGKSSRSRLRTLFHPIPRISAIFRSIAPGAWNKAWNMKRPAGGRRALGQDDRRSSLRRGWAGAQPHQGASSGSV
jgi:hypothetical protein